MWESISLDWMSLRRVVLPAFALMIALAAWPMRRKPSSRMALLFCAAALVTGLSSLILALDLGLQTLTSAHARFDFFDPASNIIRPDSSEAAEEISLDVLIASVAKVDMLMRLDVIGALAVLVSLLCLAESYFWSSRKAP